MRRAMGMQNRVYRRRRSARLRCHPIPGRWCVAATACHFRCAPKMDEECPLRGRSRRGRRKLRAWPRRTKTRWIPLSLLSLPQISLFSVTQILLTQATDAKCLVVVAPSAKQTAIYCAILKTMSSRAVFARDLASDRSAYAARQEYYSRRLLRSGLDVVRSLRLRFAQRRDDMLWLVVQLFKLIHHRNIQSFAIHLLMK